MATKKSPPDEVDVEAPADRETGVQEERSLPREKGVETLPCPTCGTELAVAEQYEDGGVSLADCPNCSPAETEKASDSDTPARETGTPEANEKE